MKVNRNSWHWWIYSQMSGEPNASVCSYVGHIAASPIVAALIVALGIPMFIAALPVFYVIKISEKRRWKLRAPKLSCPFGKIEPFGERNT